MSSVCFLDKTTGPLENGGEKLSRARGQEFMGVFERDAITFAYLPDIIFHISFVFHTGPALSMLPAVKNGVEK